MNIYPFHPSTITPKPLFFMSLPSLTYPYPLINSSIVCDTPLASGTLTFVYPDPSEKLITHKIFSFPSVHLKLINQKNYFPCKEFPCLISFSL